MIMTMMIMRSGDADDRDDESDNDHKKTIINPVLETCAVLGRILHTVGAPLVRENQDAQ